MPFCALDREGALSKWTAALCHKQKWVLEWTPVHPRSPGVTRELQSGLNVQAVKPLF